MVFTLDQKRFKWQLDLRKSEGSFVLCLTLPPVLPIRLREAPSDKAAEVVGAPKASAPADSRLAPAPRDLYIHFVHVGANPLVSLLLYGSFLFAIRAFKRRAKILVVPYADHLPAPFSITAASTLGILNPQAIIRNSSEGRSRGNCPGRLSRSQSMSTVMSMELTRTPKRERQVLRIRAGWRTVRLPAQPRPPLR